MAKFEYIALNAKGEETAGTVDAGTSTGVKRNTSAFATVVPKGTHLWAAARFALATTT